MKVQWSEFNSCAYKEACDAMGTGVADPRDYEYEYKGEVVDKYHPIFGEPKFIVALESGDIVPVKMTQCKVLKEDQ